MKILLIMWFIGTVPSAVAHECVSAFRQFVLAVEEAGKPFPVTLAQSNGNATLSFPNGRTYAVRKLEDNAAVVLVPYGDIIKGQSSTHLEWDKINRFFKGKRYIDTLFLRKQSVAERYEDRAFDPAGVLSSGDFFTDDQHHRMLVYAAQRNPDGNIYGANDALIPLRIPLTREADGSYSVTSSKPSEVIGTAEWTGIQGLRSSADHLSEAYEAHRREESDRQRYEELTGKKGDDPEEVRRYLEEYRRYLDSLSEKYR